MSRPEQIRAGRIWQIYPQADRDTIKFEGSRSACLKWLKDHHELRLWKRGKSIYALGQLIYEQE